MYRELNDLFAGVCSDVWALTPNVSDSYSTFDSLTRETECQTICVNSAYCVGFDLESIPGSTDVFKCYLSFSASSVLSSRTQFNHFDLIRNSCELGDSQYLYLSNLYYLCNIILYNLYLNNTIIQLYKYKYIQIHIQIHTNTKTNIYKLYKYELYNLYLYNTYPIFASMK